MKSKFNLVQLSLDISYISILSFFLFVIFALGYRISDDLGETKFFANVVVPISGFLLLPLVTILITYYVEYRKRLTSNYIDELKNGRNVLLILLLRIRQLKLLIELQNELKNEAKHAKIPAYILTPKDMLIDENCEIPKHWLNFLNYSGEEETIKFNCLATNATFKQVWKVRESYHNYYHETLSPIAAAAIDSDHQVKYPKVILIHAKGNFENYDNVLSQQLKSNEELFAAIRLILKKKFPKEKFLTTDIIKIS